MGFRTLDAFHLACAEAGGADVLLTTDRQFVSAAARAGDAVRVRVTNPIRWIEERND